MSIPVPNLDDRSFTELVAAARTRMQQVDPEWTDLSVHDPGIVLVEAFAHLTDVLLYRLNRVPERLYAVYLNLLGTSLGPPAAAETTLRFTRGPSGAAPTGSGGTGSVRTASGQVRVPRGTRVTCQPGLPGVPQPVFTTLGDAVIPAGEAVVDVAAADVTLHDAVLIGVGTGGPGQTFTLPEAPLVDGPHVSVGIELPPGTTVGSGEAVLVGGRPFLICAEVGVFADAEPGRPAVRVDRSGGTVSFPWFPTSDTGEGAPNLPRPIVPEPGMQVRAWYRCGGGERGNVLAGQLTVLRDPVGGASGLTVTNPGPAVGGRDGERLESALRRAPQDFQARDRAVTARDYEVLASRHGGVERARAYTRRDAWAFAARGEVEVVLVPHVPLSQRPDGRVTIDALVANARDEVRAEVTSYLRDHATIGAEPVVLWGHYKKVLVDARVVVRPDEDPDAVRTRILARLESSITPIRPATPTDDVGSGFGRPLRVSNLYRALEQSEPGVQYVDRVRIEIDQVPDSDAKGLARADGQAGTWFVGQGATLFRTTNSADGWEACATFPDEVVRTVEPWPSAASGRASTLARPGLVAVATDTSGGSRLHVSEDLGATWRRVAELGFGISDLAWVDRSGTAILLAAGENGLYELPLAEGSVPVQNLVDPATPNRGFYSVVTFVDVRGRTGVALAAEAGGGIWLSPNAGAPQSFRQVRQSGEEIRCLSVQYDGPAAFLWAGRSVPEGDGTGCLRLRVDELGRNDPVALAASWEEVSANWTGGSCWSVKVVGATAYAATQSGGVLTLALGTASPAWVQRDVNCGLPLRDRRRFQAVQGVSGVAEGDSTVVLAAGPAGLHRSLDRGLTWRTCAARVVDDVVTLPDAWLFCSGEHRVEVIRAHA